MAAHFWHFGLVLAFFATLPQLKNLFQKSNCAHHPRTRRHFCANFDVLRHSQPPTQTDTQFISSSVNLENSACNCSKIYHIALIMCIPYFIKWNNKTFAVKNAIISCALSSKQNKIDINTNDHFTVLPLWYCHLKISSHKKCYQCLPSVSTQANRRCLHSSMTWLTAKVVSERRHFYDVISEMLFT